LEQGIRLRDASLGHVRSRCLGDAGSCPTLLSGLHLVLLLYLRTAFCFWPARSSRPPRAPSPQPPLFLSVSDLSISPGASSTPARCWGGRGRRGRGPARRKVADHQRRPCIPALDSCRVDARAAQSPTSAVLGSVRRGGPTSRPPGSSVVLQGDGHIRLLPQQPAAAVDGFAGRLEEPSPAASPGRVILVPSSTILGKKKKPNRNSNHASITTWIQTNRWKNLGEQAMQADSIVQAGIVVQCPAGKVPRR